MNFNRSRMMHFSAGTKCATLGIWKRKSTASTTRKTPGVVDLHSSFFYVRTRQCPKIICSDLYGIIWFSINMDKVFERGQHLQPKRFLPEVQTYQNDKVRLSRLRLHRRRRDLLKRYEIQTQPVEGMMCVVRLDTLRSDRHEEDQGSPRKYRRGVVEKVVPSTQMAQCN